MKKADIPAGAVPIDSRSNPHEIFNLNRFSSGRYFAMRDGAVYSTWAEDFLKLTLNSGDRFQLTPTFKGRNKTVLVHKLIAYAFCPNERRLEIVHHLNGNKRDNRASNLLYVTAAEHAELHRLMKTNRAKYRKCVSDIRKSNKWKSKRDFTIIDPQMESKTLEGGYAVTYRGWNTYKKEHNLDNIPPNEIILQFIRMKGGEK